MLQLVSLYIHRGNKPEHEIHTFKSHLIAGILSDYPKLILQLWDILPTKGTDALKLLHSSMMNTKLSSQSNYILVFEFNATPLGPPVTI